MDYKTNLVLHNSFSFFFLFLVHCFKSIVFLISFMDFLINKLYLVSCIRLLETIFSSSKTMPAYLQYGKELFANCLCHTPLTGLLGPDPSPSLMGHPWDILDRWIHDRIHTQLPHFPHLNTSWLNDGNVFHEGLGYKPWLL